MKQPPEDKDMDEPVALPLDPETALKALLKVPRKDEESEATRPLDHAEE